MRLLLSLCLCLALAGAAPPPVPRRIVSLNVCADQLLVALADRRQIAALTMLARDPAFSAVADAARTLPVTRGGAEAVLALRPDLVLPGFGGNRETMAAIAGRGIATLEVPPADDYAAIVAQVRQVSRAIGRAPRGEALVAQMDAALARLPRAGRGRVAAYYQRRGYLTGADTLVDELMRRAGLVNLATKLGRPPLSQLSLEALIRARPDVLVVEADSLGGADEGAAMLRHPALRGIPRVVLPQSWTVCGGPAYVRAAASLARQLSALSSQPARAVRARSV